jgi:hypothetical protein
MDDKNKIKYINLLNNIKINYKNNNMINIDEINLTYKQIKLKYIDNKNYFAEDVPTSNKKGGSVFIYH